MFTRFLSWLLRVHSGDEDSQRRAYILNILLAAALVLSFAAVINNRLSIITKGDAYVGPPPFLLPWVFLSFLTLYILSRGGFAREVGYALVSVYFAAATYSTYQWGVDIPAGLLTFTLSIIVAGIVVGTRFALLTAVASGVILLTLTHLQVSQFLAPNLGWRGELIERDDMLVLVLILMVITAVSWLSNREIDKSLHRARRSESALKKERDNLEVKVDERTSELKRAQLEKMLHLYRLADFGKVASGLFHDLVNPLNVVSLNLEHLQDEHKDKEKKINVKGLRFSIDEALAGTKRMELFVEAARRHVRQKRVKKEFSLSEEVEQVLPILDYKAKTQQVKVNLDAREGLRLYGDPIKFNQIVTNLITNAIESYEGLVGNRRRRVEIRLQRINNVAQLSVQDWGCGIESDNIDEIFEPFYTTKDFEKGMGVGLHMVKENVEKEFGGSITVGSKPGQGTKFTVTLPLERKLQGGLD